MGMTMDVGRPEQADGLVALALRAYGQLDILVSVSRLEDRGNVGSGSTDAQRFGPVKVAIPLLI